MVVVAVIVVVMIMVVIVLMRMLVAIAVDVVFVVLDELGDAGHYAERHVIDLVMRDGERVRQEVYVFAARDPDGRFARIEETTLTLEPK